MTRPSLRGRLAKAPLHRLLLFLDYDGTLTPIVRRPDEARLSDRQRLLLTRLAEAIPVVIVSGREMADLRRMVRLPALRYVASHGLLYHEPGHSPRWLGEPAPRRVVRRWFEVLQSAATGIRGALVEDKVWSVALHDRLVAPRDRQRLRRRALHGLSEAGDSVSAVLVRGKRVLEVRPAGGWNKGLAVQTLLGEPWAADRIPVYMGDDRTDFDAFVALRGRSLTVRVGGRRHVIGEDAWLENPGAVESFLHWLLAGLERQTAGLPRRVDLTSPIPLRPKPPTGPLEPARADVSDGLDPGRASPTPPTTRDSELVP